MKSNIILVSYNFPYITGPRSLRWVQFTRYLVEKGYKVDVLTVDPEKGYGSYDEESTRMIPREVNVYRTYPGPIHKLSYRCLPPRKNVIEDKYQNQSIKDMLREKMKRVYKGVIEPILIPDKMIEWLPSGLIMLKNLARKKKYDLVISSAVPFTDHILGYFFKKWTHVPWIGDYGDPWTFGPILPKVNWHYPVDKWIESRLLKVMDRVIVTTDETRKGFIEYYPFLERKKIAIISQGFDSEEFEVIQPELGNKFRIVYTGIFYDGVREPYVFFDAVKRLKDIELEVIVVGDILSHQMRAVEEKHLKERIIFLGHQPHKRVVALQKSADLLLLFGWLGGYQIPGKTFEYFGVRSPILCITFDERDIAGRLIRKYNRGIVVPNNSKEIACGIRNIYELWQKGKLEKQFHLEPLKEYFWESQAKKLENVVKNVIFST